MGYHKEVVLRFEHHGDRGRGVHDPGEFGHGGDGDCGLCAGEEGAATAHGRDGVPEGGWREEGGSGREREGGKRSI